jgi:hypothetical protein
VTNASSSTPSQEEVGVLRRGRGRDRDAGRFGREDEPNPVIKRGELPCFDERDQVGQVTDTSKAARLVGEPGGEPSSADAGRLRAY